MKGKIFNLSDNEQVSKNKKYNWELAVLIVFIMVVIGLVCQAIASFFIILLEKFLPFSSVLTDVVKFFNFDKNPASIDANIYLILVFFVLLPGYILFYFVMNWIKKNKKGTLFNSDYYGCLKICLALITIVIVVFGFFPLLFELILVDEEAMKVLQGMIGGVMLGSIFPYFYMLIDDALVHSKTNNNLGKTEQGGKVMVDEKLGREATDVINNNVEDIGEKNSTSIRNNGWKDGYVSKHHLIYLLAIAGIIIVLLLSLLFQDSIYAGAMLSFAATLSSILLAVIAIIITLLDVAGQRSNILDVKTSVDQLKEVSEDITSITQEFEKKMYLRDTQLVTLIEEVDKKNQEIVIKFEDLTNKLNDISATDDTMVKVEEVKNGLDQLKATIKGTNVKSIVEPINSDIKDNAIAEVYDINTSDYVYIPSSGTRKGYFRKKRSFE